MNYMDKKWLSLQLIICVTLSAMEDNAVEDPHFAYSRHVIQEHLNLSEYDSIIDVACRDGKTTHYMNECTHPQKTTKIVGLDPYIYNIACALTRQKASLLTHAKSSPLSSSPLQTSTVSPLPSEINLEVHSYQSPAQSTSLAADRLKFLVDNLIIVSYPTLEHSPDKRAQLVTNFDALHRFEDKNIFFQNIITLLKDNGTLLMTTRLASAQSQIIVALFQKQISLTPWKDYFYNFLIDIEYAPLTSLEELNTLLKTHKFSKTEIITQKRYCKSKGALSSYLQQEFNIFHHFLRLSAEHKKQLCNSIAHEYSLLCSDSNGSIILPESLIVKTHRHVYSPFAGTGWNH